MRRQCWGKRGCTKPKLRWMNLESHLKRSLTQTLDNIKRLRLRDKQKDKIEREREKKRENTEIERHRG